VGKQGVKEVGKLKVVEKKAARWRRGEDDFILQSTYFAMA